jgi:hypothetical protein
MNYGIMAGAMPLGPFATDWPRLMPVLLKSNQMMKGKSELNAQSIRFMDQQRGTGLTSGDLNSIK